MENLVSVIMPVYNGLPYLKKALESVLNQSYSKLEFIIYDDASKDNSWQIIKKFQTKDKRIRLFQNKKNLGLGITLNKAIKKAKGEYVARMDADDIMVSERLEKQVKFLEKNPQIVVVGSWMKEINEKGEIIGKRKLPVEHKQIYQMMYYLMGLQHPSAMFNLNLIPANFKWYQEKKYIEDLDMFFRLLKYGQFANLSQYLMFYRIHAKNISLKNLKKTFMRARKVRNKAIRQYNYHPNLKAKFLHFFTGLLVWVLPEKYLLNIYSLFRRLGCE